MKQVTCRNVQEDLLERWMDGGLDEILAENVRRHVDTCPVCTRERVSFEREAELIRVAIKLPLEQQHLHADLPFPGSNHNAPPRGGRQRWVGRGGWTALAASLALFLMWYFAVNPLWNSSIHSERSEIVDSTAAAGSFETRGTPFVQLGTATALPGETVTIEVTVRNLEGISGIKALVKFDSNYLEVDSTEVDLSQSRAHGNEIALAAVSADGWREQNGVAFRLPIRVRQDIGERATVDLKVHSLQVTDRRRTRLKVQHMDGSIEIL